MNEFQRMLAEDHALACPKCHGHGYLGSRVPEQYRGKTVSREIGFKCSECDGGGVRRSRRP